MGVCECQRLNCSNIMCKYISEQNGLYLCNDCIDEFYEEMQRVGFKQDEKYKKKTVDKKIAKFYLSKKGEFCLKKGPKNTELVRFGYAL